MASFTAVVFSNVLFLKEPHIHLYSGRGKHTTLVTTEEVHQESRVEGQFKKTGMKWSLSQ